MSPTAVPTKASELEEAISDPKKLANYFEDGKPKPEFSELIRNYAKASGKKETKDLRKQIDDQASAIFAQMAKDMFGAGPEKGAKLPSPLDLRNGQDRAPKPTNAVAKAAAELDKVFRNSTDFFQAIWSRRDSLPNRADLEDRVSRATQIVNSFGSIIPGDGGFLVPETLRAEILKAAIEQSIIRPRARVIPMDSLRVPIPTIADTSHVSSVWGGITAYWTEEAAALTESSPTFGRVVLDAKKLTGYAEIPNELLADAVAFTGFFDQTFPQALAYFEDVAFFSGTGAGEPLGVISCPASVQVAAEAGQPTKTIVWENLVNMYSRMLPTSLGNAVWVANIDTFPQLATMALSVGTGGGPVWIGNFAGGTGGAQTPPATILGRPVLFTEKVPTLGTTGDIMFTDLSYYLVGDRQMMQAMQSEHYKFANDKTAFRITERVDGQPWLHSAITPHSGSSNTLTPVVQLASR
ncbi:phage major capsid protein [Mycobacterium sp.]|uniref:phage major capsid protein n=1 Tax=Mycobacterium sp. TaxID=1785 RepID=UPI002C20256E|nr:phage major capsid protein [Mycobacterium sp.]HTY35431.1 phage major capsid protein [Mycobacterium sp.]